MYAASQQQPRAQRFHVNVPAKLSSKIETNSSPLLTENVSCSGALLKDATRELPVGEELEVWLLMRQVRPSMADIVCPSVVVRCDGSEHEGRYDIGVQFKGYRFCPPDR
jgi:PilZ domain